MILLRADILADSAVEALMAEKALRKLNTPQKTQTDRRNEGKLAEVAAKSTSSQGSSRVSVTFWTRRPNVRALQGEVAAELSLP